MKERFLLKTTLIIVNMILLFMAFNFLPISTMVMCATLIAVVYAFYSGRFSIILVATVIFASLVALFFIVLFNPWILGVLTAQTSFVVSLYQAIYPFGVNVNLLTVLNVEILPYLTLFLVLLLILTYFKYSPLKIALAFSFFTLIFSAIYLIVNMLSYFIGVASTFFFYTPVVNVMFIVLYFIIPFMSLVFVLLHFEILALCRRETIQSHKRESKEIKHELRGKRIVNAFAYMAIISALLITLIMIIN